MCNVSSKTIKNDISSINEKISSYDSSIDVDHNVAVFNSIYNSVHWHNIVKLNQSIDEEDLIFLKLIIKTDYIAMSDFASEVFMSKSKLEKLIATNPNLNRYLDKKRNVGIKVDCDIEIKIKLLITTLLPYVDDLNYLVTSRALIQQVTESDITIESFKSSIDTFNMYVARLGNITDNECKILILLILINNQLLETNNLDNYIDLYISSDQSDEKVKLIISNIVKEILEANNIRDLDSKLYLGLINHLSYATMNRYPNTIEDDMELRLKQEHSYTYNIALELYKKLCISLGADIPRYEINYITMYIQSLINTSVQNQKFRLLIVCQYGLSVSHYIHSWIEKHVELELEIAVSSVLNFWKLQSNLNEIDLVVTTIENLEVNSDKLIKVDTIPLESQLYAVRNKIINSNFQKQMDSFFDSKSINTIDIKNIEQVYEMISNDFKGSNSKFLDAMKARTEEGLSNVNGVIIMHSDGSLITENRLIIYKLKTPIDYDGEVVRMIFVFAFTTEFIEQFGSVIKQIYKVIYAKEYVSALYETTTDNQFMWMLKNQIKGASFKKNS